MSVKEVIKPVGDAVQKAGKTAEGLVNRAWSMLDAAAEKTKPSSQISKDAIRRIKGK
jgi:hypothetical protein